MSEMRCSPMTSSRYFAQGKGKEKKTKKKKRKEKRKCVRAQAQEGAIPQGQIGAILAPSPFYITSGNVRQCRRSLYGWMKQENPILFILTLYCDNVHCNYTSDIGKI